MSFVFQMLARESQRDMLESAAEEARSTTGLMIYPDPRPRWFKNPARTFRLHFWSEERPLLADTFDERGGFWVTDADLRGGLATAVEVVAKASSEPLWLEAMWVPVKPKAPSRIGLREVVELLRTDRLYLGTRYEIAPTSTAG